MRLFVTIMALLVAGAGTWLVPFAEGADRRPRTRSHRWRKTRKGRPAKRRRAARLIPKRLAPGRWRPEIVDAVEKVLELEGFGDLYSPDRPPVALIAWDDVFVTNRLSEALFQRLVTRAEFKFDDAFWKLIPSQYGRVRIRAGYTGFVDRLKDIEDEQKDIRGQLRDMERRWRPFLTEQDENEWREKRAPLEAKEAALRARRKLLIESLKKGDSYYRMYRKGFLKCYGDLCRDWGRRKCSVWLTQLLMGFREDELRTYVRSLISDELRRPVGVEEITEFVGDQAPVKFPVGLRRVPEMEDLHRNLVKRGFDAWFLSESNEWAAQEFAKLYGVDPKRVVGIGAKRDEDGVLTGEVLIPIPISTGKAEAIAMFIGRAPALAVGGEDDDEMLRYGRGVRVKLVDPNEMLPGFEKGKRVRWLLQPRFSPARGRQKLPTPPPPPARPEPPAPEAFEGEEEAEKGPDFGLGTGFFSGR